MKTLNLDAEEIERVSFVLPGEPDDPYVCVDDFSADLLVGLSGKIDDLRSASSSTDGSQVSASIEAYKLLLKALVLPEHHERLERRLNGAPVNGRVVGVKRLTRLIQWLTEVFELDPLGRREDGRVQSGSDLPPRPGRQAIDGTSKDGLQDPRRVQPDGARQVSPQ